MAKIINALNGIAGPSQFLQNRTCRGQRIQPDGMRQLMRLAGIGRQYHRQLAVVNCGSAQRNPTGNAVNHRRNPARIGPVRKTRKLQIRVASGGGFEADNARKDASVHLWQDHMHRQISRRKPPLCRRPIFAPRGGQSHLKDRTTGAIKRGIPGHTFCRKRRCIYNCNRV